MGIIIDRQRFQNATNIEELNASATNNGYDTNFMRNNADIFQKIKINDYEISKCFKDFSFQNSLQYSETPTRLDDFTLTSENIDAMYIPTATFSFGILSPLEYSKIVQSINQRQFTMELYDYEIGMRVKRVMYASQIELGKLAFLGKRDMVYTNAFQGVVDPKITVVSKYAYASYAELVEKAIEERE